MVVLERCSFSKEWFPYEYSHETKQHEQLLRGLERWCFFHLSSRIVDETFWSWWCIVGHVKVRWPAALQIWYMPISLNPCTICMVRDWINKKHGKTMKNWTTRNKRFVIFDACKITCLCIWDILPRFSWIRSRRLGKNRLLAQQLTPRWLAKLTFEILLKFWPRKVCITP